MGGFFKKKKVWGLTPNKLLRGFTGNCKVKTLFRYVKARYTHFDVYAARIRASCHDMHDMHTLYGVYTNIYATYIYVVYGNSEIELIKSQFNNKHQ